MGLAEELRMGIRHRIRHAVDALLLRFGMRLVPASPSRPWDTHFRRWIHEARGAGVDPNDVGDREWSDDALQHALREHYLPHVDSDSVVLELGPGSGRLTRHLIGRCRELILADYSELVCQWLADYLPEQGARARVLLIEGPALPEVESSSVDTVLAHGVFEHLDLDDLHWFLLEFARILRPGGAVAFNFDNVMSDGGLRWLRRVRGSPGKPSAFRFYHPETLVRLASDAGLELIRVEAGASRFAYVQLRKPG